MNDADLPAMPFVESNGYVATGLTKREYFAALAMQGLLSRSGGQGGHFQVDDYMAREAWAAADCMLHAQKQEPTQ
jgi:hypothetical protein